MIARVHPCYSVGGRYPVVSQEFKLGQHEGLDIMYRRLKTDPPYTWDDPRGTPGFYVPPGVLVGACCNGVVHYSKDSFNGWRIELYADDRPTAFFYAHLVPGTERVQTGDKVVLGQVLAEMGGDPSRADVHHTVHLHFGTKDRADGQFYDPSPYLRQWAILEAPREP